MSLSSLEDDSMRLVRNDSIYDEDDRSLFIRAYGLVGRLISLVDSRS